MKRDENQYSITVNGVPNYQKIPKVMLESIAKKLVENILKEIKENKTEA